MNRRRFLRHTAAAASLALAARAPAFGAEGKRVERIGLQLYTVRSLLAKDVPGTLAAIAAAGYTEVETAGYAGLAPAAFAAALEQAGLAAPAAHVRLPDLDAQFDAILDAARTIGHEFLVVPVPEVRVGATQDDYRRLAERLNRFGARTAQAGIQLAYHNHDFEFATVNGKRPYELLLERCDRALVKFELDLFWAAKAGADPAALLRAAPGRFVMCHVKDMSKSGEMVAVGDGIIDFAALFRTGNGFAHYFVEHDDPGDPLDCIRRGAAALRALRY